MGSVRPDRLAHPRNRLAKAGVAQAVRSPVAREPVLPFSTEARFPFFPVEEEEGSGITPLGHALFQNRKNFRRPFLESLILRHIAKLTTSRMTSGEELK